MAAHPDTTPDRVASGREALASGAWEEALESFRAGAEDDDRPEAWEGMSWAAWWLGDEALTLSARERAYRRYRAGGDSRGAARMAVWLASDVLDFRGEDAVAAGWLERAGRLLEDQPPCAEHGWLWLIRADLKRRTRDEPADVEQFGRDANRLGRELQVADLEAVGLALQGMVLVERGEVEAGMRRLDEASAIAIGDDFELPLSSGWTLCCVVSACEGVGDFPRAEQWCQTMRALVRRWGGRNLMGACRSVYGNVLATGGDWPAAEAELMAAIDDFNASRPAMAPVGLVRLGELRARQGRTDEARALFDRAGSHPAALVGLGRLALADGDGEAAHDAAERVLRRLPGGAMLDRLPALELVARSRIALGRLEDAAAAADTLERFADRIGTPYLLGRSHLVRAEVAAAEGRHHAARRACEDAVDALDAGAAPYEAALARVVLARSLLALGRTDAGASEARAARDAFAALGAARDVVAAEELIAAESRAGRPLLGELTAREVDVLRLVAQGMSDAEIAERLVLSPHTVHRHVANVRTKLRLPSRSAAVAYAARAGLI